MLSSAIPPLNILLVSNIAAISFYFYTLIDYIIPKALFSEDSISNKFVKATTNREVTKIP